MRRWLPLLASVLPITLTLCAPRRASADVPPSPDLVERCTMEQQGHPQAGDACVWCEGSWRAETNACARMAAGFAKRCRTYGALQWRELWCGHEAQAAPSASVSAPVFASASASASTATAPVASSSPSVAASSTVTSSPSSPAPRASKSSCAFGGASGASGASGATSACGLALAALGLAARRRRALSA